jgi:hypothetical protein
MKKTMEGPDPALIAINPGTSSVDLLVAPSLLKHLSNEWPDHKLAW